MTIIVAENPFAFETRSEPLCREGCFARCEPLVGEFDERPTRPFNSRPSWEREALRP